MDFKIPDFRYRRLLTKMLLIMQLTAIFIFALALQVCAKEGHSQNVTLQMKNAPLKKVFKEIKKQTGYYFLYTVELLAAADKVNLIVQNASLQDAMNKCLQNTSLTYSIVEKTIVIKRKIPSANVPVAVTMPVPPLLVKGKVTDEQGNPLQDVSVILKVSNKGVSTDKDGMFTIQVPEGGGLLVFSYVGFESAELKVSSETVLAIRLIKKESKGEEVVVIGYGTSKKSDMTGSVSSISPEKFSEQNVTRIDQALQGRAAGVIVTNPVGAPGADVSVRIRGANSALGSNEPLYVIDGFVGADYNLINPNDIASLEVLKDASSTAIYGSRGSNGVIIVTTKNGRKGKVNVNYQGQAYVSDRIAKLDVLNAPDFATMVNDRNKALNLNPAFTQEQINVFKEKGGVDWQDEIYRTAVSHDHQLSISGGSDKSTYLVSFSYLDQNGIVEQSYFKRYSLRSNMTTQVSDKLSFRLNFTGTNTSNFNTQIRTGSTSNPIVQAQAWAPTTPIYDANGKYTINDPVSSTKANPLALINDQENKVGKMFANAIAGLKYEVARGLSLNVQYAVDYLSQDNKLFSGNYASNFSPNASISNGRQITLQSTSSVTYSRVLNDIHNINAVAVFESQEFKGNYFNATATGLKFPELKYDNLSQATAFSAGSSFTKWSLLSYVGRVNYTLKDRYLLSFSVRRDGSSKFYGDNKYSTFPAAALGWNMSKEDFIKNLNFFSMLKVRASWGLTGSQAINPYATESAYNTSIIYPFSSTTLTSGIQLGNPGNRDLKWETTEQKDIGFEMGLFGGRVNVEFDYFTKNTSDLLLNRPLPLYAGGGNIVSNLGEIQNKGWEFSIGGTIIKSQDLLWKSDFNIFNVKNKVVSLGDVAARIFSSPNVSGIATQPEFVYEPGQSLGSYWGLTYLGTWKPSEAVEAAKFGNKPGDARYLDLNDNAKIGAEDYHIIGHAIPETALGWNNTVSYRNFTLNFFFQGVFGVDKLNYTRAFALFGARDTRQPILSEINSRYIPGVNETSNFPAFSITSKIEPQSTMFMESGDFVRLKNLSLSYKLPRNLAPNLGDIRLSLRAANLLTFTDYKGIDPESSSVGIATDLNQGIDYGSYPNAKTYTFGLSITF